MFWFNSPGISQRPRVHQKQPNNNEKKFSDLVFIKVISSGPNFVLLKKIRYKVKERIMKVVILSNLAKSYQLNYS